LQERDNTFIVQCKLLLHNSPNKSSKIGKGWKDFCTFNRLKEGDILVFVADKKNDKEEDQSLRQKRIQFLILHFFFSLLLILCMVFLELSK